MTISRQDVDHVALLARLDLSEGEKESYTRQLNAVLEYMHEMNALDTGNVEPTAHVLPIKNVLREDQVLPGMPAGNALQNAPEQQDGQFRVPRIV